MAVQVEETVNSRPWLDSAATRRSGKPRGRNMILPHNGIA